MTFNRVTSMAIFLAMCAPVCCAEKPNEVAEARPNAAGANGKRGADELGAPDFIPSAEHPVGWRGDGTGRYPGATPPLEWYRRIKNPPALACQSKKPSAPPSSPLNSIDIALTDWLAVGPWV